MNNVIINEYERLDDLHRNGLMIIQDPKRFCFGIDAVLLSSFVNIKKGEKSLDIGTGTGVIPILLTAKTEGSVFHGIEIQHESAEMAKRSVELNNLSEKVIIDEGDIKNALDIYKPSYFDVVISNPPYIDSKAGIKNNFTPKTIARHEVLCSLDDVVGSAAKLLKTGGRFYMIHRPHRLIDIIVKLREKRLEPKTMRFVQPYKNKEPNMVLIEAVRGGRSMVKVLPALVIYNDNGGYTDEVIDIYYG